MHQDFLNSQALKVIKQRNMSLVFGVGLLIVVILQQICIWYKSEKIVLMPPEINKTFWVSNKGASEDYLIEMSVFLSDLLLDQTAMGSKTKRDILLKYVSSSFYNAFYKKLLAQEEYISSNDLATKFTLKEAKANSKTNTVILTGEMRSFIATEEVKREVVSYELKFEHSGFKYLLCGFKQLSEEQK